jgi:hypothetical protein
MLAIISVGLMFSSELVGVGEAHETRETTTKKASVEAKRLNVSLREMTIFSLSIHKFYHSFHRLLATPERQPVETCRAAT